MLRRTFGGIEITAGFRIHKLLRSTFGGIEITAGFRIHKLLRSTFGGIEITAQEVMKYCLRFKTTCAYGIYRVVKVTPKFMFI